MKTSIHKANRSSAIQIWLISYLCDNNVHQSLFMNAKVIIQNFNSFFNVIYSQLFLFFFLSPA